MDTQNLRPYLRENIDVLFIGLNPSDISDTNGHYFSVKQSFWDQLLQSGLLTKRVDKSYADEIVFGTNMANRNSWNYGIVDIIHTVSDRDSTDIKPSKNDYEWLKENILLFKPRVACIIHSKVMKCIDKFTLETLDIHHGCMGKLLNEVNTTFFYIPFPHGNKYTNNYKVSLYKGIVEYLESE